MGFDIVYKIDLYAALGVLARFGHSIEGFLRHFESAEALQIRQAGESSVFSNISASASQFPGLKPPG